LETAEGDCLLEMETQGLETIVRIWTNSASEPDRVVVGIAPFTANDNVSE